MDGHDANLGPALVHVALDFRLLAGKPQEEAGEARRRLVLISERKFEEGLDGVHGHQKSLPDAGQHHFQLRFCHGTPKIPLNWSGVSP